MVNVYNLNKESNVLHKINCNETSKVYLKKIYGEHGNSYVNSNLQKRETNLHIFAHTMHAHRKLVPIVGHNLHTSIGIVSFQNFACCGSGSKENCNR